MIFKSGTDKLSFYNRMDSSTISQGRRQSTRDISRGTVTSSANQDSTTSTIPLRRSSRGKNPPIWMNDFVSLNIHQDTLYTLSKFVTYSNLSSKYQAYLSAFSAEIEPVNYQEANMDPRWIEAMQSEIDALNNNNTWEVVNLPEGKIPVGCK